MFKWKQISEKNIIINRENSKFLFMISKVLIISMNNTRFLIDSLCRPHVSIVATHVGESDFHL